MRSNRFITIYYNIIIMRLLAVFRRRANLRASRNADYIIYYTNRGLEQQPRAAPPK